MTKDADGLVGSPDIVLVLPRGALLVDALHRPSDQLELHVLDPRMGDPDLERAWFEIHREVIPSFDEADLVSWFDRYRELALENGIFFAVDSASGRPISTAGSIRNDKDGMFPGGGQIAWVATEPESRRRGLATWLCAIATFRLLDAQPQTIYLCTGDGLLDAIRIYRRLGFVPYLYAPDQESRWQKICKATGGKFEPHRWYRGDGTRPFAAEIG